jgi:hypothetical protein
MIDGMQQCSDAYRACNVPNEPLQGILQHPGAPHLDIVLQLDCGIAIYRVTKFPASELKLHGKSKTLVASSQNKLGATVPSEG